MCKAIAAVASLSPNQMLRRTCLRLCASGAAARTLARAAEQAVYIDNDRGSEAMSSAAVRSHEGPECDNMERLRQRTISVSVRDVPVEARVRTLTPGVLL